MIQRFSFEPTSLQDVVRINTFFADDIRGYLQKDYEKDVFLENGIEAPLQECFYTYSHKGVIRANHFQLVKPQKKLMRCVLGEVYDVVTDLRKDSVTFGKWEGFYLSDTNRVELFIPEGFGHGYLVLSELAIMSYKCSGKFYAEYDGGIMWDDPDIGIEWPLEKVAQIILAEKDKNLLSFREFREVYGGF